MIIKITCCHRDASSNVMRVQGGFCVKTTSRQGNSALSLFDWSIEILTLVPLSKLMP
jgi:hypothetical protein